MDLLNTRAVPGGVEVEWLAAAGAAAPRATAREWDAAVADVRRLREAFRRFVDRHAGRPLTPAAAGELAAVNAVLAADDAYQQVAAGVAGDGPPLVWRRHRRPAPASAAVLLSLAEAIGDLVTTADFTLVSRREGAACTLQFLDRTKSHARRWCSMAGCGNRAKARRPPGRRAGRPVRWPRPRWPVRRHTCTLSDAGRSVTSNSSACGTIVIRPNASSSWR